MTSKQGVKLKSTIKAAGYTECSALKKFAVDECFVKAVSSNEWYSSALSQALNGFFCCCCFLVGGIHFWTEILTRYLDGKHFTTVTYHQRCDIYELFSLQCTEYNIVGYCWYVYSLIVYLMLCHYCMFTVYNFLLFNTINKTIRIIASCMHSVVG